MNLCLRIKASASPIWGEDGEPKAYAQHPQFPLGKSKNGMRGRSRQWQCYRLGAAWLCGLFDSKFVLDVLGWETLPVRNRHRLMER